MVGLRVLPQPLLSGPLAQPRGAFWAGLCGALSTLPPCKTRAPLPSCWERRAASAEGWLGPFLGSGPGLGLQRAAAASTLHVSERRGPCRLQNPLWGRLRALRRLHRSLACPLAQTCFLHPPIGVMPRAPLYPTPAINSMHAHLRFRVQLLGTPPRTPSQPLPWLQRQLRARGSRVNTSGQTFLLSTRSEWEVFQIQHM